MSSSYSGRICYWKKNRNIVLRVVCYCLLLLLSLVKKFPGFTAKKKSIMKTYRHILTTKKCLQQCSVLKSGYGCVPEHGTGKLKVLKMHISSEIKPGWFNNISYRKSIWKMQKRKNAYHWKKEWQVIFLKIMTTVIPHRDSCMQRWWFSSPLQAPPQFR